MVKKETFKKGDVLFYWNEGGHTNEIVIVLGLKETLNKSRKVNKDKTKYYFCMFPDKSIETIGESWLYKLEEHYKSSYIEDNNF